MHTCKCVLLFIQPLCGRVVSGGWEYSEQDLCRDPSSPLGFILCLGVYPTYLVSFLETRYQCCCSDEAVTELPSYWWFQYLCVFTSHCSSCYNDNGMFRNALNITDKEQNINSFSSILRKLCNLPSLGQSQHIVHRTLLVIISVSFFIYHVVSVISFMK